MESQTILGVPLQFDPALIRQRSEQQRQLDSSCCAECAVFAASVGHSASLAPLEALLRCLGLDPMRPDELWGAADGGFLEGWWSFSAQLTGSDTATAFESSVELSPGLSAWLSTEQAPAQLALDRETELTLAFHWTSTEITTTALALFPDLGRDAPA